MVNRKSTTLQIILIYVLKVLLAHTPALIPELLYYSPANKALLSVFILTIRNCRISVSCTYGLKIIVHKEKINTKLRSDTIKQIIVSALHVYVFKHKDFHFANSKRLISCQEGVGTLSSWQLVGVIEVCRAVV